MTSRVNSARLVLKSYAMTFRQVLCSSRLSVFACSIEDTINVCCQSVFFAVVSKGFLLDSSSASYELQAVSSAVIATVHDWIS